MPQRDLIHAPVARTLFLFCLPVLGSNILQSLNGSINAIWVGRYLGEAALTATANANMLMFVLLAIVFGISSATSVLVGQAIGRKDTLLLKQTIGTSATFFVMLSIFAAGVGYIFTPNILALMGTPMASMQMAIDYLHIITIALPFMYFYNYVMMALRGSGDANTSFRFMLASAGLDITLNPVFIFGWGPLPKMGVAGSALATLFAQSLTLFALLWHLYKRQDKLWLNRSEMHYFRFHKSLLKVLVNKGLPLGLQMLIISSSALGLLSLVNQYGTLTAAAFGALNQVWAYVQMPALAIMVAVSAMAAQNIGANRWDRVRKITQTGLLFNLLLTGTMVGIIYLFEQPVLGLFLPKTGGSIEMAMHINGIVLWSFILFGMVTVLLGTIRASGTVWPPLLILFLSLWVFRLPFAKYAQHWLQLGADAIWWSFVWGTVLSLLMGFLYYWFGSWRNVKLVKEAKASIK